MPIPDALKLIIALLLGVLLASPTRAQAQAPEVPSIQEADAPVSKEDKAIRQLFAEHIEATKRGDFAALARQIHPEEVEDYKADFLKLANAALDHGEFGKFARVFPWVNSIKQIEETPARTILANTLTASMGRDPGFLLAMRQAVVQHIGNVPEGEGPDRQVHLVYRLVMTVRGNEIEQVSVITLRKGLNDDEQEQFYLRVDPKAKAMIDSLLSHYERR